MTEVKLALIKGAYGDTMKNDNEQKKALKALTRRIARAGAVYNIVLSGKGFGVFSVLSIKLPLSLLEKLDSFMKESLRDLFATTCNLLEKEDQDYFNSHLLNALKHSCKATEIDNCLLEMIQGKNSLASSTTQSLNNTEP